MPPEGLGKDACWYIIKCQKWYKSIKQMAKSDRTKWLEDAKITPADPEKWEAPVLQAVCGDGRVTCKRDMWSLGICILVLVLKRSSLHATVALFEGEVRETHSFAEQQLALPGVDDGGRSDPFRNAREYASYAAANVVAAFVPRPANRFRGEGGSSSNKVTGTGWVSSFWNSAKAKSKMDASDGELWQPIIDVIDGCLRFQPEARWTAERCLQTLDPTGWRHDGPAVVGPRQGGPLGTAPSTPSRHGASSTAVAGPGPPTLPGAHLENPGGGPGGGGERAQS